MEANKETQQGITCEISDKLVNFWEKVSVKKKTSFGQIKEKSFFEENSSENLFLIKSKVKFLIFSKNQLKNMFFA